MDGLDHVLFKLVLVIVDVGVCDDFGFGFGEDEVEQFGMGEYLVWLLG